LVLPLNFEASSKAGALGFAFDLALAFGVILILAGPVELSSHVNPPEAMVIAAGDFNISKREEGNLKLRKRLVEPHWLVAHRLGCTHCKGTYYYGRQDEWSFFDMILAAPSLAPNARPATPWKILPCSVRIANSAVEQSGPDDTPKAFNPNDGSGTSDHWPLVVEIEAVHSRMAN
jgi:hypothetical protein